MKKKYDRPSAPTPPMRFDTRHSLEEWAYMHVYNMLSDDAVSSQAPSVFNAELARKVAKDSSKEVCASYNYVWFAVEGITIEEQVELLREAYAHAVSQFSLESGENYDYSRQI